MFIANAKALLTYVSYILYEYEVYFLWLKAMPKTMLTRFLDQTKDHSRVQPNAAVAIRYANRDLWTKWPKLLTHWNRTR